MVNSNYGRIYQFLLSELNGKVLCSIVGICPNTRYDVDYVVVSYIDIVENNDKHMYHKYT